ncbi:MAG: DUF3127 domain-containing protein [Bacteroidaceae bacterium]|nr:DUF3127 domain-containing protein [Bacteroidaceae bacterium]
MEIQGKIIAVMPLRSGTSQRSGNTWAVQEYLIETTEQYPKKCLFNVFGEERIKLMDIKLGEDLTVSFDIDAREYNGRWYNDIRAYKVERGVAAQPMAPVAPVAQPAAAQPVAAPAAPAQPAAAPAQPAAAADPFSGGESGDNLPF